MLPLEADISEKLPDAIFQKYPDVPGVAVRNDWKLAPKLNCKRDWYYIDTIYIYITHAVNTGLCLQIDGPHSSYYSLVL